MKKIIALFSSVLLIALCSFSPAQETSKADKLIGVWQPSDGRSYLKIDKIGNKFYGRVVWLEEANNADGTPRVDENNPDEKLRNTPLKGYRVLKDFVYDEEEGIWSGGTIYDPKNGTTYNCKIELKSDNKIEVRGYVGAAVFGRTDVWTRLVKKK